MSARGLLPAVGTAGLAALLLRAVDAAGWRGLLAEGRLVDTDAHMRLARLRDALADGRWTGGRVLRDGWPEGVDLHWTALFDAPILAGARVLVAAGLAPDRALTLSGGLSGPASYVLLAAAAAWALGRLGPGAAWLAGALAAGSAPLLAYGGFGRADHHVATILPLVLAVGHGLRAPERPWLHGAVGGAALGFGLWVSVEALPFAVGLLAVLAAWRLTGGAAGALAVAGLGQLAAVVLGVVLDPPGSPWALDRLSWTTVEFAAFGLLALAAADLAAGRLGARGRVGLALAAAGLAAAAWVLRHPELLGGAAGVVGDDIARIALPSARELQPVRGLGQAVGFLGLGALGALALARRGAREPTGRLVLGVAAAVLALTVLGASQALRFGTYACALGALGLAAGLAPRLERVRGTLPTLGLVLAGALPFLAASMVLPGPGPQGERCDPRALARALPDAPMALLSEVNAAPYLLWLTPHRTVAGPYHTNRAGLEDMYRAYRAPDDAVAREVATRRGLDGLLVCTRGGDEALKGEAGAPTFYDQLRAGGAWDWLLPGVPQGDSGFVLYAVREAPAR